MKRKMLLILSSLILVLTLALVACGSPDIPEPVEDPTPVVEEPAAPDPEPEPIDEPEEEPMDEPTEEPMDEPEEEPTEEPMDEPEEMEEEADMDMGMLATPKFTFNDCDESYEGETIVVYQQAGLTGPLAQILGDGFINGTNDAVAAINAEGGICGAMLETVLEDTQYDPPQEIATYERFRAISPPPMFILTYGSGATIVLKDRVIEDEIVNIAAGLDANSFYIPRDGWTVGVAPVYSDQFAGFLEWAQSNWDDIRPDDAGDDIVVGVVGWANPFGAGATSAEALAYAESLGITVLPLEEQEVAPTADVTGQVQNLLLGGANIIWIQSLSFGPAQVIGTIRALGAWDQVVVGGVNWAMNTDVLNILGQNAALAEGMYGIMPALWWNDTDAVGVQRTLEAFEAGGYPESDKGVSYLLSYGSMYAIAEIIEHAIISDGFENLSGTTFFDAMKDLGTISAAGLYDLDVTGENRAPKIAQIRQVQMVDDGLDFILIEDFFELPDTRPAAP
ncbi:MAG: ABC transporter substrate-binding protein [Chloroflexota bacterium]